MVNKITSCRICGNQELTQVIDLGKQALTGVFPQKKTAESVTSGPLALTQCSNCHLVQLAHSYSLEEMYGDNYGYRSGLNKSMVEHLHNSVSQICALIDLCPEDVILDIGSNDSTLLQGYPSTFKNLIGIDPTGSKFKNFYPSHISLVPDFFSKMNFEKVFPGKKAKVVTSFSMFYDLEQPTVFMQEVSDILDDNGLWCMEQSYLPLMLKRHSYDTICHEHLEYYCLSQIKYMSERTGLRIIDVNFNDINGGSFKVFLTKKNSLLKSNTDKINQVLQYETKNEFDRAEVYFRFASQIENHKKQLMSFLGSLKNENKKIMGLGASTKGNVLLQYCDINVSAP